MADKEWIHLEPAEGLAALKEIVDAQPNFRNEEKWADAFFEMACVLRMIKVPPVEEPVCSCYSIPGDDPNCKAHRFVD